MTDWPLWNVGLTAALERGKGVRHTPSVLKRRTLLLSDCESVRTDPVGGASVGKTPIWPTLGYKPQVQEAL